MLAACATVPSIREDARSIHQPVEPASAPLLAIEAAPWPTKTERQSDLEALLRLPEGRPSLEIYQDRAGRLTALCMADGGFSFPLDEPLSEEAEARLSKVITYRGERVDGGCDNWGMDYAFPGNFFAEDFQPLRMAALGRAEYVDILAAYDDCFRGSGFDGPPDVSGLSDEQAQTAIAGYIEAGNSCDRSTGLTEADRSAEVLAEDTLVAEHRAEVDAYVTAISADLAAVSMSGRTP